jgi:hypothetical protein
MRDCQHKLETERTDFLNWIPAGDCQDHHESISQKRYGNTGSWLLANNTFEEWVSDGVSKILWCYGQGMHAVPRSASGALS